MTEILTPNIISKYRCKLKKNISRKKYRKIEVNTKIYKNYIAFNLLFSVSKTIFHYNETHKGSVLFKKACLKFKSE